MRRCPAPQGKYAGWARKAPPAGPAIAAVLAVAMALSIAVALSLVVPASAGTTSDRSSSRPAEAAQPLPDRPGGTATNSIDGLAAVSCTSASFCEALSGDTPNAAEWNGGSWKVQPMKSPGGSGLEMEGVSCTAQNACEAVGYFTDKQGDKQPVAEHWDGTAWGMQKVLAPGDGMLLGVSCVSASDCEAVGDYLSGGLVPLAEVWNGQTWQQQPIRPPGIATAASALRGVSCTTANNCEAVGFFTSQTTGSQVVLAEVWNGSAWKKQTAPTGKTTNSTLVSVSCPVAGSCEAVGDFGSSTIAEAWNGTHWSTQPVDRPGAIAFLRVSCATANVCEATGTGSVLAEDWNGTRWAAQSVPEPSEARLNGVSCPVVKDCEATGFLKGTGGIADLWNGTTWMAQPVP